MEGRKRHVISCLSDDVQSKRQKIQSKVYRLPFPCHSSYSFLATTNEITVSHFEDLSNELIFEIFEYLEYFHAYQALINLNLRFNHLLTNSNLPIKINISSMSKPSAKHYKENIIEPNMHRIRSLRISNTFPSASGFSSLYKRVGEFRRVQTLILDRIDSQYVQNLLDQLISLPFLCSLALSFTSSVTNKIAIYCQIFGLSALKYCKLSFEGWTENQLLPVCTNENRSIEHLVITNATYVDELARLLSYVPQIRHLSLHLSSRSNFEQIQISPNLFSYLTHVSLKITSMKSNRLFELFKDLGRNTEVLRVTVQGYDADETYLDADRWKSVILTHISKLRVFDYLFDHPQCTADDVQRMQPNINQFTSPFWTERQWFFTHHIYQQWSGNRVMFYSINLYRYRRMTHLIFIGY